MQITEHTSTVLRLRAKSRIAKSISNLLLVLLLGFPFLLKGLLMGLLLGRVATLNCDRVGPAQVTCELRSSSLLAGSTSITQLQGAEVEGNSYSDDLPTFRVVVITEDGNIPLTRSFTSGVSKKQENVDRINAFVKTSTEPSLRIQEDQRGFALLGVVCSLVGGGLIFGFLFWKLPKSCLFDKNSDRVTLIRQNMLFQSDIREERIDAIKVAQIDSDENTYNIRLVLQSGDSIVIGSEIKDREVASGVAKAINQFLNLSESVDSTGNNWKAYYYMYMRLPKKS